MTSSQAIHERLAEAERAAAEFGIPPERAYSRPELPADEAFGPTWRGYTVEMFGCVMEDGPALTLDRRGRSTGLIPYPAWQMFPPDASAGAAPLVTLRLHRVRVRLKGTLVYMEWRWQLGGQPSVTLIGLESEKRPDVIAKLYRARRLFAGLSLGGRPPSKRDVSLPDIYSAIRELEANDRQVRRSDVAKHLVASEDAVKSAHRGAGMTWADAIEAARRG